MPGMQLGAELCTPVQSCSAVAGWGSLARLPGRAFLRLLAQWGGPVPGAKRLLRCARSSLCLTGDMSAVVYVSRCFLSLGGAAQVLPLASPLIGRSQGSTAVT